MRDERVLCTYARIKSAAKQAKRGVAVAAAAKAPLLSNHTATMATEVDAIVDWLSSTAADQGLTDVARRKV